MKLNFKKKKECADATAWYDVLFDGSLTLKELVDYILTQGEWGKITRTYIGMKGWLEKENMIGEYKDTAITTTSLYESLKDKEINKITANGGWGSMSYFIIFK